MLNKILGNIFKGDKIIWMVFFFLFLISLIEVFSASSALIYKTYNYWDPILKHGGILVIGTCMMILILNVQCKYFKILTPFMLIISLITLLWAMKAGEMTNGAQRWISLVGIQFQPSELAKGTTVLATAQILSAMQTEYGAVKKAFYYVLTVSGVFIGLIAIENLSTAVLLFAVVFMMMIIGRVPFRQIAKLVTALMTTLILILIMVFVFGKNVNDQPTAQNNLTEEVHHKKAKEGYTKKIFHRMDTWKSRIYKFTDKKEVLPHEVDLDKDAQIAHANIAIASSNFIGKGPGNSEERDFLSQAFSDFIYAIVIEEMGFEGAAFVAILYIILLIRTGRIAARCENNFPAYLAMGLALLLVTQAMFNMCVAVGLVPVTGQPLPLISKGGTSTIINCVYIGAILSVSRSAKKKKEIPPKAVVATET